MATKLRRDPQRATPTSLPAVCPSGPCKSASQNSTSYPRPRFSQGVKDTAATRAFTAYQSLASDQPLPHAQSLGNKGASPRGFAASRSTAKVFGKVFRAGTNAVRDSSATKGTNVPLPVLDRQRRGKPGDPKRGKPHRSMARRHQGNRLAHTTPAPLRLTLLFPARH